MRYPGMILPELGLLVLAACMPVSVLAANHNVTVGGAAGNVFTPSTVSAQVGDTITFTNAGGFHNVASDDQGQSWSFHCSDTCGSGGTPSATAWVAVVNITSSMPTSLGFHCDAHQALGMVGTINITVPVELQSFDIE